MVEKPYFCGVHMRNCLLAHIYDTPPPLRRISTHFANPPPPYSAYVIKVRSRIILSDKFYIHCQPS